MGRNIAAHGEQAGALLIDRAYQDGDEFQWLRELVKNGIEAGATKVQLGVHWDGSQRSDWGELPGGHHLLKGVFRAVYYDNGDGMGDQMAEYMTGLLALDSKDSLSGDLHSNKAMGARVSTLPWNKLGMVVVSWHANYPEGRLMWLHHVPSAEIGSIGHYEAATLEWDDETGTHFDEVCPADVFEEFIGDRPIWLGPQEDGSVGTGCMFLMLGDRPDHNTILGPSSTWKNASIHRYLAERFWDIPDGVEISVDVPYNTDLSSWSKYAIQRHDNKRLDGGSVKAQESKRHYNRGVLAGRSHAEQPSSKGDKSNYQTIEVPNGGTIHVYLAPEERSYGSWEQGHRPMIGYLYRGELYHKSRESRTYRQWGVGPADVRKRLWIIVEPREALNNDDPFGGVYPTGSRTSLQYVQPLDPSAGTRPEGKDLPFSEYRELFARNIPEFVKEAIFAATSSDTEDLDDELVRRIADRLSSRFETTVDARSTEGEPASDQRVDDAPGPRDPNDDEPESNDEQPDDPTERKRRTRRRRKRPADKVVPDESGSSKSKKQKDPMALPNLAWDPTGESSDGHGATWTVGEGMGTVTINQAHPVFSAVLDYWHDLFATHDHPVVDEAIWSAYGVAMTCRVAHVLTYNKKRPSPATSSQLEEGLLSGEALTASLFGLASEDKVISDRLSGRPRLK